MSSFSFQGFRTGTRSPIRDFFPMISAALLGLPSWSLAALRYSLTAEGDR